MRTGFIGLGDQGGPMAQMILADGHPLGIWARRPEVRAGWRTRGAIVDESPAALAAASDLVCLCVTGDADVRDLLIGQGMLDAMRKRTIVAIHATIRPESCVELGALAARRGLMLLDLPVSGSGHAALARKLLVMAGGDAGVLARVMPVLESYAGTVLRMGPIGSAMQAKLVNNLMATVNIGQACAVLELGRTLGLDAGALREAILVGTGRSFAMELVRRLQVPERAAHVLAILAKDVDLALGMLSEADRAHWAPLAAAGLAALGRLAAGHWQLVPMEDRMPSGLHRAHA